MKTLKILLLSLFVSLFAFACEKTEDIFPKGVQNVVSDPDPADELSPSEWWEKNGG